MPKVIDDLADENASSTPVLKQAPILKAIIQGKPPGAVLMKDSKLGDKKSKITAKQISEIGLGLYKPKDKNLVGAVFNPAFIELKDVKALDEAGKLAQVFPALDQLAESMQPEAEPKPTEDLSEDQPQTAEQNQPMPKPAGTNAQRSVNRERVKVLDNEGKEPSKRTKPGAGLILNSLLERAI